MTSEAVPMDRNDIQELARKAGRDLAPGTKIVEDTTEFMDLEAGDVMLLQGEPHLITRNEKEVGFGMDDDPKYWVKRTLSLATGETHVVKLVFFEEFVQSMGGMKVRFYRSPIKEAKVLDAVRNHERFMQGRSVDDAVGNNVRIIDFIRGPSLNKQVGTIPIDHDVFFRTRVPGMLDDLCGCLEALSFLHERGLVHGDVRWDHILWDRDRELYRWIDFDYAYDFPENPAGADLFGLGKIVANVVGKGPKLASDIVHDPQFEQIRGRLREDDFSILEPGRLMNLQRLYPYIPDRLNNVLRLFSKRANVFYESIDEVIGDLRDALRDLHKEGAS